MSWYVLRALSALRLVRDLREPPRSAIERERLRDGAFDLGMFRSAWRRAAATAGNGQAAMQATLHAKRAAFDDAVAASLQAAEELTRAAHLAARGLPSTAI